MPEWEDDQQIHALFCEYDGHKSEEFMVKFWQRAIDLAFQNFSKLCYDIEELKVLFTRK